MAAQILLLFTVDQASIPNNSATHYQYFQFGFVGITYFKSFSLKTNDAELSKGLKVKAPKGIHESMKRDIIRRTILFMSLVKVVVQKLSIDKRMRKISNKLGLALKVMRAQSVLQFKWGMFACYNFQYQPHKLNIVYTAAQIIWQ